jgi:hypothetical protein
MTPTLGERVFTLLVNDAAVSAHIGSRIYPNVAPDVSSTLTYAVYLMVDDIPMRSFQGLTPQLTFARVQIDCYSKTYLDVHQLANEIDAVLGSRVGYQDPQSTRLSKRDMPFLDPRLLHRVSLDYQMTVREV